MRCKTCDYPLWNLKARQCPECGTAFTPDEFEFVLNSVRYCCPHCDQAYYGTGEQGHLSPVEFNCVKCSHRVSMNEMILRPAEGVDEGRTQVEHMPWLEPGKEGRIRAWYGTVGMALVAPGKLMRNVPNESPLGPAVWFAAINAVLISMAAVLPLVCLIALPLSLGAGRGSSPAAAAMGMGIGVLTVAAISFGAMMFMAGLGGLVTHGLLRLTGPTAAGIGRTYQAALYSTGANIFTAIPCLGLYVGWIWWLISGILMTRNAQGVSGIRAAFSVLTTPVLLVLGLAFWFGWLIANAPGPGAFNGQMLIVETTSVTAALRQQAVNAGGVWPRHASQMLNGGGFGAQLLVATGSNSDEKLIPVGDTTLDQLALLPANKRAMVTQAAADALPADVIAHRMGDFVFTYHGIDLHTAPPKMWIVIQSMDPSAPAAGAPAQNNSGVVVVGPGSLGKRGGTTGTGAGPGPGSGPGLLVGNVDGTVQWLPGSLSALLAAQNQLRAGANLPPLPDPATVTHARPARTSDADLAPAAPAAAPSATGPSDVLPAK